MSKHSTAILALHYQNEVLHPDGKIRLGLAKEDGKRDSVITGAQRLLAWGRRHAVPIIFVHISYRPDFADVIQNCQIFKKVVADKSMAEGSWGAEPYAGLEQDSTSKLEFTVHHSRVNAFYGSQLQLVLDKLGVNQLIVGGIATNSVVATTVAHAADVGYQVTVVRDACASADPELHRVILKNIALVADVCDSEVFESIDSFWAHFLC